MSPLEAMREAFRRDAHTPNAILRRLHEMGFAVVSYSDYTFPRRPESDADQLRAIADWLDRLDDDAGYEEPRTMQDDLRRIADAIR